MLRSTFAPRRSNYLACLRWNVLCSALGAWLLLAWSTWPLNSRAIAAQPVGAVELASTPDGFQPLFNGQSLAGWRTADPSFWSVQDGAITAKITPDHPLKENLYLIWEGGQPADFELKLKHRVFGSPGINCGFQFRSKELLNHDLMGYQVDNNLDTDWLVRLYDEHGRHTLAWRGQRTLFNADGQPGHTEIADAKGAPWFRLDQWHEYHLTCIGPKLTLKVDGRLAAEVEDLDPRERDLAGLLALQLHTGPPTTAQFKDIQLKILNSSVASKANRPTSSPWPLKDKTLVAWVTPSTLDQRGGSVLTLEKPGSVFDAIVFGEIAKATWMPGSDSFRRTRQKQDDFPTETAVPASPVQVAIVYRDRQIELHRNGQKSVSYTTDSSESFPSDSHVLLGLRHLEAAAENRFFTGVIDDARIYAAPLSAEQIAALKPNQPSDPAPLAWWDFENGSLADRMGTFTSTTSFDQARVLNGQLLLDKPGAFLLASRESLQSRQPSRASGNIPAVVREYREQLLRDPHRPGYHFVIPEGTAMPFDPNGAIYWKGRYHLFYIFQDHRGHNWGHVSSSDLFHWRHHPTGLIDGMFSGNCFVNGDGRPTMCYHQVGQGNAFAVAVDDDLNDWKKLDSNPITPKTRPGDPHHDKYRSWDPFGWREGETYYAIFGGEHPGLAKSKTLAGEWNYVGDFLANTVPGVSIHEDVSCADFFQLGNRHMLLCISHRLGARYYLGDWKNEQFHPTSHEQMSWVDNSFFAPESLLDNRGRRIMWAWIFDAPQFKMRTDSGWSGTLSLPRVLSLGEDGKLRIEPPAEIERLRAKGASHANLQVPSDSDLPLDDVRGDSLELSLSLQAPKARQFGLKVRCSPDGEEQTLIYYDPQDRKLKIDTQKSSLDQGPKSIEAAPLDLAAGEPLRLRVFVDKSVVEVFANGRQAVMRRVYPARSDSLGVRLFSVGGPAIAMQVQAWELAPSNPY